MRVSKKFQFFTTVLLVLIFGGVIFAVSAPFPLGIESNENAENSAIERWMGYGVLPWVGERNYDANITYYGFCQIMQRLLAQEIDERYTFNSGLMYIRQYEALRILTRALGQDYSEIATSREFLTFRQLAQMLDEKIETFVINEFNLNLADSFLENSIVINHLLSPPHVLNSVLANVGGSGDIVIVPRLAGHILLDNINIEGNIVITHGEFGPSDITLHNSNAKALFVLGSANITMLGNTQIEYIHIYAPAQIDTIGLSRQAAAPNINANAADLTLTGQFNHIEFELNKTHAPVLLPAEGRIESLSSEGSVILVGDVEVGTYDAIELSIINSYGFYRDIELAEAIEKGMQAAMSGVFDGLLEDFEALMRRYMLQLYIYFPEFPIPPEITPPPPDPPPAPEE
ncbi:MAG: hypothetical protein LBE35_07255 [Clostridiales bacterium]|jgi:hypothetical protein|nr:hypothetical protein [Clostridiales bacterium]